MSQTFSIVKKLKLLKNFNFLKSFKNLKLANKLNLILIFFLISILTSNIGLLVLLQQRAQQELIYKELNALSQMMFVVRNYTYILPLTISESYITPEIVGDIFKNLRKNVDYQNYQYQDLTLNPNNLKDKFETQLIKQFAEGSARIFSGFHTFKEGKSFYTARCMTSNDSSKNVSCHQTENKSIIVQIIYIPINKVFLNTQNIWLLTVIILFDIFAIAIVNLLLNRTIIKPIAQIAKDARLVSTDKADVDFGQRSKHEKHSKDEIVSLAASFNRMKESMKILRILLHEKKEMLKQKKQNN